MYSMRGNTVPPNLQKHEYVFCENSFSDFAWKAQPTPPRVIWFRFMFDIVLEWVVVQRFVGSVFCCQSDSMLKASYLPKWLWTEKGAMLNPVFFEGAEIEPKRYAMTWHREMWRNGSYRGGTIRAKGRPFSKACSGKIIYYMLTVALAVQRPGYKGE